MSSYLDCNPDTELGTVTNSEAIGVEAEEVAGNADLQEDIEDADEEEI